MSQFDLAGPVALNPSLVRQAWRDLASEKTRAQRWTRIQTAAAVTGLMAFAGLALASWIWSGAVVPWDSKNQFYPFFRFLAESLSRGEIPVWNPYHFGGHPSAADPQSLLFTPSMVLFALLAPKASMMLFDAVIFGHLFAGGIGVLGLFRRRGWHPAGAVLAAMVFMLGGAAASRLQHTGIIISYSFFPLALLCLEVALGRRSYFYTGLFALFATLMVLGRDQVAFLFAFALVGAFGWHVARDERPGAFFRSRLPLMVTAAVLIVAALLVPSLLTMQFLAASNRPGIPYGVAAAGSLHPANFATFLVGNIFGSTDWTYNYFGPGYEATELADFTDRTINYLFIGTLPMVLLLWHGLAGGRILGRNIRYVLLAGLIAALYAVGRYTPVFGLLFDYVPGFSLYRRPADATFLLNVAFAIASGYLLHRYVAEGFPRPFRGLHPALASGLAVLAAGLVIVTICSALSFADAKNQFPASLRTLAWAAAIALGVVAVLLLADRGGPRRRAMAAIALVAFAGGELIHRNAASSLNAESAARYAVYDGLAPSDRRGLEILAAEIRKAHQRGAYPRVEILGLGGPWQNAAMVLGLENTLGYNPLRIADYARAVGPGENAGDPNLRHFPGTFRGYRCNLAGLLSLEYLVLDRPLNKLPRHVPRPRATLIYSGDNMYVYQLGEPAPRAYLAMQVKPVDRETVLEESAVPDFNRSREALIDYRQMAELSEIYTLRDSETLPDSSVQIRSHGGSRVVLEVDSDRAGVLVLHDLYYPGWQVRVDGDPKTLLRANILFRGVEVPAGRHLVEFEYKPFSWSNLGSIVAGLVSRDKG